MLFDECVRQTGLQGEPLTNMENTMFVILCEFIGPCKIDVLRILRFSLKENAVVFVVRADSF